MQAIILYQMRLGRTVLRLILFLCLIGTHVVSSGQDYDLIVHSTENGLPHNKVNDICQDSSGVLWVATDNGVTAFDGIQFENYTSKNGLAEGVCSSVFIDDKGQIWVGHQSNGVSVISKDSIYHFTEASGLANNEVHGIIQTQDGRIWVATFSGISIYNGTEWTTLTTNDGLTFNNIQALLEDANGAVWAGTYGAGITVLQDGDSRHLHMGNGLINNYITDFVEENGSIYIGTLGGVSKWNGKGFADPSKETGLTYFQTNAVDVDGNGRLWMATFIGIIRADQTSELSITEENGLPQNEVLDIFLDSQNNVWLGTQQGLIRVQNLALSHFSSTEELDIYPSSIFVDSKNQLWAGNEAGGVLKLEDGEFIQAFEDPDINDHQISCIAEDSEGSLWFGTMDFGGLFQMAGGRFYIYSDEFGLADNNINCLATDGDGMLYIGTPNGLSTFDGLSFEMVFLSDDFSSNHITALEVTKEGLLIGAQDGSVFLYQHGDMKEVDAIKTNSTITDFEPFESGYTVSTVDDGVFVVSDDGVKRVNEAQGFTENGANALFIDGDNLYAATNTAIVGIRSLQDSTIISRFGRNEGYKGGSAKRAAVAHYNGAVFIGTEKGITRFEPNELSEKSSAPKTIITELQLSYRSVDWGELGYETSAMGLPEELSLPYTENNLRFFFRGIDHYSPDGVKYRWKLEGYEKDWTPWTDQRSANYPSLPPGDYTFRLSACSASGQCNNDTVYAFSIRPPFWQTVWFYLVITLIVVVLTLYYVKRRERVLREEKEILEATVQERTKELREQKEIVEHQNKHITESIEYASNIQKAILPSEEEMQAAFADHFVFYRPKETVGGDFYWAYHTDDVAWAAAVDCTGHGVAGAFMSMIGSDLLNQIIIEKRITDPAQVLLELDKGIKLAFAQSAKEFEADQGMDVALVKLDKQAKKLHFAGAQRPLYIYSNRDFQEFEGDKISISCTDETVSAFTKQEMPFPEKASIYLFSDGITDQFGGPKGKKFMVRRLKDFLAENHHLGMKDQHEAFAKLFDDWRGEDNPQLDDVMLMGIQL